MYFKVKIIGYCYHSVNVNTFGVAQSDHIKRLLLYLKILFLSGIQDLQRLQNKFFFLSRKVKWIFLYSHLLFWLYNTNRTKIFPHHFSYIHKEHFYNSIIHLQKNKLPIINDDSLSSSIFWYKSAFMSTHTTQSVSTL